MRLALIVVLSVAFPARASAFHEIESFERTANTGGGAGYFFTGAPRYKGYECSICHTGGPGAISIEFDSVPGGLASGEYELGTEYEITVRMLGETKGLQSAFNPNTFTWEIVADTGEHVGTYGVDVVNTPMRAADEGHIAIAEGFGEGELEWTFWWTSPDADVGPATLYLAALDGDGASDPDRRWIDAINDDVAVLELRLCVAGTACPEREVPDVDVPSAVQCSGAYAGGELLVWVAIGLVAIVVRRRRR